MGVEGLVLNFVESSLAGQIINGRTESGDGDTIRKLAGERAWSDRGFRALHLAADLGRSNVVRALLDSGAHKNARALFRKVPTRMQSTEMEIRHCIVPCVGPPDAPGWICE